jgi:hypothetical protein
MFRSYVLTIFGAQKVLKKNLEAVRKLSLYDAVQLENAVRLASHFKN